MSKLVRKYLLGPDSKKFVTIAQRKLDELNGMGGAPFKKAYLKIGSTQIIVQTGLLEDRITIISSGGGYIVALTFLTTYDIATGVEFGTGTYQTQFYGAALPKGAYTKNAVQPSSENPDLTLAPASGVGIEAVLQIVGGAYTTLFATTPDLGKTFSTILSLADQASAHPLAGISHQVQSFKQAGVRGFWLTSPNGSAQRLGRFITGASAPTFINLPGTWSRSFGDTPSLAMALPNRVFGFQSNRTEAPYFFISKDGGATVSVITSNAYLDSITLTSQRPETGQTLLYPISNDVALFIAPVPGAIVTSASNPYAVWRVNLVTGVATQVLTLSLYSIVFANLGDGMLLLWLPNNVISPDGISISGLESKRYLSTDNGRTWTLSASSLPQSTRTGPAPYPIVATAITVIGSTLYTLSWFASAGAAGVESGGFTDVRVCASTDQAQTWQVVGTVATQASLPTETSIVGGVTTTTPVYPSNAVFAPVGTSAAPLPIDSILPWRTDDSVAPPDAWVANTTPY